MLKNCNICCKVLSQEGRKRILPFLVFCSRSGTRLFWKQALVKPQHSSPHLSSQAFEVPIARPGPSYPLLHGVFVVGHVLLDVFVLELEDSIYKDQNAQWEDAWDDHSDCVYSAGYIINGNHDVDVIVREVTVLVIFYFRLITAHPVFEDWFGVTWLHR